MKHDSRWRMALASLIGLLTAASMAGAQSPGDEDGEYSGPPPEARLKQAVEQLKREAQQIDQIEEPDPKPHFSRLHPALKGLEAQQEIEQLALSQMERSLTGNAYRDSYIRWHLAKLLIEAEPGELRDSGQRLLKLIRAMPDKLRMERKNERRYEPPAKRNQFMKLRRKTRTVTGYPPFQEVHHGASALKHMKPGRRKKMKPVVEKMKKLRKQFKVIVDKQARKYNDRIEKINWIIRQYRGELIYALILTGDPSMLQKIIEEVAAGVQSNSRIAFDMLSFVYLAALDRKLNRYDQAALERMGQALEKVARGADEYRDYGGRPRNFADYSFHLIHMLQDGPSKYVGHASP